MGFQFEMIDCKQKYLLVYAVRKNWKNGLVVIKSTYNTSNREHVLKYMFAIFQRLSSWM